jgi:HK97 family phage major capsid protein/HK97 family phage prohead protease
MAQSTEREIRSLPLNGGAQEGLIFGYAANYEAYDMGAFNERIERSAFNNLDSYDIHALLNHSYDYVLARRNKGKGTLELRADEQGLYFEFSAPETNTGKEARTLIERGDLDQASWAFTVKSERWENVKGEKPTRVITEVAEIYDISLTPRGANPSTAVAMRSLESALAAEAVEPEQTEILTPNNMDPIQESAENPAAGVDASALAGGLSSSQKRDMARFNIVKAIREARTGKLTGVEAEMNQEGLAERRRLGLDTRDAQMGAIHLPDFLNKEMRTNTVTGGTGGNLGGDLVYTDPGRYVDFLYPNTPMLGLCSVAENLVGNVQFPVQDTDYTLNWNTETGAASAQDLTFSTITMSPKRAVIAAAVSNQLLAQEYSQGIQARMVNQLNQSFNKGLEAAVLTGTGSSNQPTGIYTALNGTAQDLALGAISYDDLVDMEALLAANNALNGRLGYVTHPNVVAKLKKTKVDAGSGRFLVEGMLDPVQTANGYNIYSTTLSKKTAGTPDTYGILFGNFEDVQLGFWGGATLLVDPYTEMLSSTVRIYVERFMDIAILRQKSFVIADDVTI